MNTQTHTHTDRHTHTQISDCRSSLASAEIEILIGMGNQPRFVGSGKIGWARLTETIRVPTLDMTSDGLGEMFEGDFGAGGIFFYIINVIGNFLGLDFIYIFCALGLQQ